MAFIGCFQLRGRPRPNKPLFFMNCGIHAREWVSPATCMYIIKQVLVCPVDSNACCYVHVITLGPQTSLFSQDVIYFCFASSTWDFQWCIETNSPQYVSQCKLLTTSFQCILVNMCARQPVKELSVLMLCAPNNRRRPFLYHTKMADFEYFHVLSVFSWSKLASTQCIEYGK